MDLKSSRNLLIQRMSDEDRQRLALVECPDRLSATEQTSLYCRRNSWLMREASRQSTSAVIASDLQLLRMRRAIDVLHLLIAATTHRIHDSRQLIARMRPNGDATPRPDVALSGLRVHRGSSAEAPAARVSSHTRISISHGVNEPFTAGPPLVADAKVTPADLRSGGLLGGA